MAENKALVIDVNKGKEIACSDANQWNPLEIKTITDEIDTGSAFDKDNKEGLNAYVSGVPSVFARVHLFKYALVHSVKIRSDVSQSINIFYASLLDQWRKLITAIALFDEKIEVRRIKLTYSDGKSYKETSHIYEPKGAFGNMLLMNRRLWCDPNVPAETPDEKLEPYVDILKFDHKVIGATSPETLLFSSTQFSEANNPSLFQAVENLSVQQKARLFAYLGHVKSKINEFGALYALNISYIDHELEIWMKELKEELKDYDNVSDVPSINKFLAPFSIVFNHSSSLYSYNGAIFASVKSGQENGVEFDPKSLLLPKDSEIAQIRTKSYTTNHPDTLAKYPLHLMKASVVGDEGYAYFALPLSEKGLQVFGNNIGQLLQENEIGSNQEIRSTLTATYDPSLKIDNLKVLLKIRFSGESGDQGSDINEVYTVKEHPIQKKDLIVWPNFVKDKWSRYFIYSELPHDTRSSNCPFTANPIVACPAKGAMRMLLDEKERPIFMANGDLVATDARVNAKLLVSARKMIDNPYKYEIFESKLPYYGLALSCGDKPAGFLVIKYGTQGDLQLPRNMFGTSSSDTVNAVLGIDFGSTNSSVAYCTENGNPEAFSFHNKSVSLLLNSHSPNEDESGEHDSRCMERNIFFFQRREFGSNAIKSILAIHDKSRIDLSKGEAETIQNEVIGGFPCLENELPISSVSEQRINLRFDDDVSAELVHNMKWADSAIDIAYRKSYLRTLLLQIYAELYDRDFAPIVPNKIRWSYPSSFSFELMNQYSQIWDSLKDVYPFDGEDDAKYQRPVISTPNLGDASVLGGGLGNASSSDSGLGGLLGSSSGLGGLGGGLNGLGSGLGGLGGGLGASPAGGLGGSPLGGLGSAPSGGLGSAPAGGLGCDNQPKRAQVIDLAPKDEVVRFGFKTINMDGNYSMTEANAVANKFANNIDRQSLLLCFDIGGSTADISALCQMYDEHRVASCAMVKQNSIRFAAQNVSRATKYAATSFKNVLLSVCQQFEWSIPGLNCGENRYSPDTASFYFDQVVDRMDVRDLPAFYKKISTDCQGLMCTNLFVTGLIMFYAGQITKKLVEEVRKSDEAPDSSFRPMVYLKTAGKGARIFEWLSCINKGLAENYYRVAYLAGLAGTVESNAAIENAAGQFIYDVNVNEFTKGEANVDIKYEVSMGLVASNSKLLVPSDQKVIECMGEDNFYVVNSETQERVSLNFDDAVSSDMFRYLGSNFMCPQRGQYVKFQNFVNIFYMVASNFGISKFFSQNDILDFLRNMELNRYIKEMPEYQSATKTDTPNKPFNFIYPPIILEGMNFLDEFLMKKIK